MASLTERSLDRASFAVLHRDEIACNQVIAEDAEIDDLEVRVDHDGMALMMRYHPFASDFRNVLATMKFGVNLERIADQSVNIARRTRKILPRRSVSEERGLLPLVESATSMVRDCVRAFADRELGLAHSLRRRDRALDKLNREFAEEMTVRMQADTRNLPTYLDLMFIARFYERIGDLAKAIGEDIVFAISATETRHLPHHAKLPDHLT